jgi:uncharacterized Zn finger protein
LAINFMSRRSSFIPYVSAAEKRRRANKAANVLKKTGHKPDPVRLDGRTIARSFWAKAWCKNLESYSDYANRLPRGRSYLRSGSVVDLQIAPGVINAAVSGSALYKVTITIKAVKQAAWKALKTNCAGQVGSLMDLLQGKLSAQVMEIITRRETGLFPEPAEIGLDCSCPDWAGMCKHVAATLYAIGVRLDEKPELLFMLRAADHHELITEASKSVTTDVSTAGDGSAMLTGESLEAIFGIEIEPATCEAAPPTVSESPKSRDPSQTHAGSSPKGRKTTAGRNGKVSLAHKAPRARRRAKSPSLH